MFSPWILTLIIVLLVGVFLWLCSLWIRDASVIDIFWGPLFLIVAAIDFAHGSGNDLRKRLMLGLITIWSLRLAAYLAVRNVGQPEDRRYAAMRERYGRRWRYLSLPIVFLLQPLLAWTVSIPLQASMLNGFNCSLGWLDVLGTLCFLFGVVIETIADQQLRQFHRDGKNRSQVLNRGLWRYSRHPNYFGECLVWWGLGLIGVAASNLWSFIGPVLMTALLLRISGVTLLEETIEDRRPGYREYKQTTNAFFLGPPRPR